MIQAVFLPPFRKGYTLHETRIPDMSDGLDSLQGVQIGNYCRVFKGDTRSLDYRSNDTRIPNTIQPLDPAIFRNERNFGLPE